MRRMADPVRREIALGYYRMGLSHDEVAKALDITTATLRKEEKLDPGWREDVQRAMSDTFTPVLQHAVDLAMKADVEGENEGAIKALDIVMKYYTKQLDREHQTQLLDRKIEAEAELEGPARFPVLSTPEAVAEYQRQLMAGPVIDVESWEDTDEEPTK